MELKELLEFVAEEDERLKRVFSHFNEPEKWVLAKLAKVYEEMGEVSQEILASHALQRKEKLNRHSKGTLAAEMADMIITTLLLSNSLDIDIESTLKKKIKIIKARDY